MGRITRRRVWGVAIITVAALVAGLATLPATAATSRASSRWNHIGRAPGVNTVVATDLGSEPGVNRPIWKTLHLIDAFSPRFTFVDVAPKGDSPGDYDVFKDPILTSGGLRIGTIDAQCISAYSDQCSGSIRIPGKGQITFGGITPLGVDPDHYAITGGTGQFAGVGGVMEISFPFIDAARITLTITR